MLIEAGVNLASDSKPETVRFIADADIEGVARKGDPVWRIEWKEMASSEEAVRPHEGSIGAHVHVRTARTRLFPQQLCRPGLTAEDGCRVFLKNHPYWEGSRRYRPLTDNVMVTNLDRQIFQHYRKMAQDSSSQVRPYALKLTKPSEAHYVRVDFEGHPDVEPLLMALRSDLTVVYAGVLDKPLPRHSAKSR